jgi:hypothetical protein
MKKCSKCKEVKVLDCFNRDVSKRDLKAIVCKDCNRRYSKSYRQSNIEYFRKKKSAWRLKNPKKVKAYNNDWRENNPEKKRANSIIDEKRARDNLYNSYIRRQLNKAGIPITPETIEYQRASIKLHRLIKIKSKEL